MTTKNVFWHFPLREFFFMKIETLTIIIMAILIFFYTFLQSDQSWFQAVLGSVAFIAIYVLISFLIQKIRKVEEKYFLTPHHFEVIRKTRRKIKKEKISLKDIKHHKLDKFLLGGYLITKKSKKHVLFFNNKNEVEEFETFLKKHLKSVGQAVKKPVKKVIKKVTTGKKKTVKKKVTKKKVKKRKR